VEQESLGARFVFLQQLRLSTAVHDGKEQGRLHQGPDDGGRARERDSSHDGNCHELRERQDDWMQRNVYHMTTTINIVDTSRLIAPRNGLGHRQVHNY
jgi:hypothetical protein